MKKITILAVLSMMSMVALAQDIIITTEKEKIEAKVEEVSGSTIKYKKYSYLDGPTYILDADKIVCVAYENDEVDLMTITAKERQCINNLPAASALNNKNVGFITKNNKQYTLLTENGIATMDKHAYERFIYYNSPEAWKEWKKGTTLMNTGWGLFAGGIASVLCIGLPMYIAGCSDVDLIFMSLVGPCLTIASIPLLTVGASKRNNSYKNYNQQTLAQLTFGSSQNGVGLRINF